MFHRPLHFYRPLSVPYSSRFYTCRFPHAYIRLKELRGKVSRRTPYWIHNYSMNPAIKPQYRTSPIVSLKQGTTTVTIPKENITVPTIRSILLHTGKSAVIPPTLTSFATESRGGTFHGAGPGSDLRTVHTIVAPGNSSFTFPTSRPADKTPVPTKSCEGRTKNTVIKSEEKVTLKSV